MRIGNMKIGAKLGLGFGVVIVLAIIIGASGYWGLHSLSTITINMLRTDAQISENAARARANVLGLRRYEKDLFLNLGKKDKEEEYMKKWKEQYEHLTGRIAKLDKVATLQKDKDIVKAMNTDAAAYNAGMEKVWNMVKESTFKTPPGGQCSDQSI